MANLLPNLLFYILAGGTFFSLGGFGIVSWREGERRAAFVAAIFAVSGLFFFSTASILPPDSKLAVLIILTLFGAASAIVFIIPVGKIDFSKDSPIKRFDERDIMFSRARLTPGSPEFNSYYTMHPENLAGDELTRSKPGLLSMNALYAQPFLFASASGSFSLTEALRDAVNGQVAKEKFYLPAIQMTEYIKNLARYYGALEVGITNLKPYHVYSHIGRGSGIYGAPIEGEHKYAIAFTVEMDFAMIGANPTAPGVVESAREYVEAARVAIQLAAVIRQLGYPARAHMDGNYRIIAPLVARDAGLGEIGRMGLLMTPRQGPRVRINVVTTDLQLVAEQHHKNAAVIDYCTICKKCAENCPVKAIPFDQQHEIDGAVRWRISADACFRYWNVIGTDCGRCMTVCPYSHPDSMYHNIVRRGVDRSGVFRRITLHMDNMFYGKKPKPRKPPQWTQVKY